jgi:hypothetical protein
MKLLVAISGFSIAIPLVIGCIRLRKVDTTYYPFFFLLFLGFCNEVLSYYLIEAGESNAVSGNIYLLLESLLIVFQFKKWGLYGSKKLRFQGLATLFVLTWVFEIFLVKQIEIFASYFIIIHAFVIVLLSISMINKLLAEENREIYKQPVLIISAGFILFFTNAILAESFYIYGIKASNDFQSYVLGIMVFINLPVNLLYTLAALWMSRKQTFSYSH